VRFGVIHPNQIEAVWRGDRAAVAAIGGLECRHERAGAPAAGADLDQGADRPETLLTKI
jgi:hypothetical protein